MQSDKYLTLNYDQKRILRKYVMYSYGISLVLTLIKNGVEGVELLPTLGLGSLATDAFFVGLMEFISRMMESDLERKRVPYVHLEKGSKTFFTFTNFIPFFAYVRFGVANSIPALTGKIKI